MEKIQKHLNALQDKKTQLEMRIAEQEAYPVPDALKIQEFKKQKLAIKQEIEEITGTL